MNAAFFQKLKTHLSYSWYLYLLWAGLSIALWATVFDRLAAPAPNEQLTVFTTVSPLDEEVFSQTMRNECGEGLKIAYASYVPQADYQFAMILATRLMSSDILILPESVLGEGFEINSLYPLDTALLKSYCSQPLSYRSVDGVPYGALIYDPEAPKENGFTRLYGTGFIERYYLFLGPESVNTGAESDLALLAAAFLLEGAS